MKKYVYDQTNHYVVYKDNQFKDIYDEQGNSIANGYYGAHSSQIGPWNLRSLDFNESYNSLSNVDKAKVAKIYLQYIKVPSENKKEETLSNWVKRLNLIIEHDPDPIVKEFAKYCFGLLIDDTDENVKKVVKMLSRPKKLDQCYVPTNGFHPKNIKKIMGL